MTTPPAPSGRRRISMSDVAKLAGVSAQTVSRVANGFPGVVDETRQQVLAAMRELDYRPNGAARALKSGRFRAIGVILFSLATTGNVRTLEAITTEAARQGYAITLIPVTSPTLEGVHGAFTRLGDLAVDAAILLMEVHAFDAAAVNLPASMDVVIIDSEASDRYAVVDTEQADGARQAVAHLLSLGHRTVHHLAGPADSYAAERRLAAWRTTLEEAGADVPEVRRGDWSPESGYRHGLELAADPTCTAVFVANDEMALGVLRACDELGRKVPTDVSVVGFDDIGMSASFPPPLTTVHQDFAAVGRHCVRLVIDGIQRGRTEVGTVLVPVRLVVRESTAPPAATSTADTTG